MSDETYMGREVTERAIVIRKTGDGLSEAMKAGTDQDLALGDEGYVVLSYRVVGDTHEAVHRDEPSAGGVRRKFVLDAVTATFIDDAAVEQAIDAQEQRNLEYRAAVERAKQEAKGQHQLDDWELTDAHDRGEHASGLVEHCPKCDVEVREVAAEADEDGSE